MRWGQVLISVGQIFHGLRYVGFFAERSALLSSRRLKCIDSSIDRNALSDIRELHEKWGAVMQLLTA